MTDETSTIEQIDRPTGTVMLQIGATLLTLGVIAAFFWATTDPTSYGGYINPEKLRHQAMYGLAASGLAPAGALMLLAGYIVRALYFLDGVDRKPKR